MYVLHMCENYGHRATIVFYGYDSSNLTKESNDNMLLMRPLVIFCLTSINWGKHTKEALFLTNNENESRLISWSMTELVKLGISCKWL